MKKLLAYILVLTLSIVCKADILTSHQKPTGNNSLDLGTSSLLWRYIYGHNFTDGTATWSNNDLTGFDDIIADSFSDGTFGVEDGVITGATWNGLAIDISDYTNLVAGTNISLSGDTLNVDDAFVKNNTDDSMDGTLTLSGLIIVASDPPITADAAGTAGSITFDDSYVYVCVSSNTWKRAALSTWSLTDSLLLDDGSSYLLLDDGSSKLLIRP